MSSNLLIFGCPGAATVAANIVKVIDQSTETNCSLGELKRINYSMGEFKFDLPRSVRGSHCVVVAALNRGISDNIIEQFFEALVLIRTLKDCHAGKVTLVMAYLPCTRQEKQWAREGLLFPFIVDMLLMAGVDNVITFDLHEGSTVGLFRGKCTHIFASYDLIPVLKNLHGGFDVICSADTGAAKMAEYYSGAKRFNCEVAVLFKNTTHTPEGREIEDHHLAGEVEGKKVLLVDELCDGGGTLSSGAEFLINKKGAREIVICIVHTVGSRDCKNKLVELCNRPEVKGYVTTDSIIQVDGFFQGIPNLEVISLQDTIGQTVANIHQGESVSKVYLAREPDE